MAATGTITTIATPMDLTSFIPKLLMGGNPVTSFDEGTYSGTVVWTKTDGGGDHSGIFEADTKYTAKVALYPAAGYAFPAVDVSVTHTGAKSTPAQFTHGNSGTVSRDIAFPNTSRVWVVHDGTFSGSSSMDMDSAIDVIRAAKAAGYESLYLSTFDTRRLLILEFDESDRGKRVYMAGRWEIEREG
jgi:hypothetical protein